MTIDLQTIGAALRRKLGPLPVWGWALIGGVILYWFRSRGYFSNLLPGGSDTGTTLQPRQSDAREPQPLQSMSPGESVYDPNTGTLHTAPGGDGADGSSGGSGNGDAGGGGGADPSDAINNLADAMAGGITVHVDDGDSQTPGVPGKAKKVAKKPASHSKAKTGSGKRAPGKKQGHSQKPGHSAKPGGTHGKPGEHKPATTHKPANPRSDTHVRTPTGGRTTPRGNASPTHKRPPSVPKPSDKGGKAHTGDPVPGGSGGHYPPAHGGPAPAKTPAKTVRQRATVPLVTHATTTGHATATPNRTVVANPPRASAPAPRTVRTPSKAVQTSSKGAPARTPTPAKAPAPPPPRTPAPPPRAASHPAPPPAKKKK